MCVIDELSVFFLLLNDEYDYTLNTHTHTNTTLWKTKISTRKEKNGKEKRTRDCFSSQGLCIEKKKKSAREEGEL